MDLDINISKFEVEVRPVTREDNIKAFAIWKFMTNVGILKISGGTIRRKEFGENKKSLLTYDPPAVRTRGGFNKVFFLDNKDLFKRICDYTIKNYCDQTGEINNETSVELEEVDLDDLPF